MKFEIGQIVELINDDIAADKGAIATVKHIDNNYISVVWKRDSKWHNQGDGGYYLTDFKPHFKVGQQLLFSFMSEAT